MNKEDLWLLFKKTGKIEYYLKYKSLSKESIRRNAKKPKNI